MTLKMPDDFNNLSEIEYGYDGGDDQAIEIGAYVVAGLTAVSLVGAGVLCCKNHPVPVAPKTKAAPEVSASPTYKNTQQSFASSSSDEPSFRCYEVWI